MLGKTGSGYTKIAGLSLILFIMAVFPVLLGFSGCSNNEIIDDEYKAASVYVDLLIMYEKKQGDTAGLKTGRDAIFRRYDVTEKQFRATMEYYNKKSGRWQDFFRQVNVRLEEMRRKKSI